MKVCSSSHHIGQLLIKRVSSQQDKIMFCLEVSELFLLHVPEYRLYAELHFWNLIQREVRRASTVEQIVLYHLAILSVEIV